MLDKKPAGAAMGDVWQHAAPAAPPLGALAYTQGDHVPAAGGGGAPLAHEAWHVVQQKEGRVKPTAAAAAAPFAGQF